MFVACGIWCLADVRALDCLLRRRAPNLKFRFCNYYKLGMCLTESSRSKHLNHKEFHNKRNKNVQG